MSALFSPRPSEAEIRRYLAAYGDGDAEMLAIGAKARQAGYYTKSEFIAVCDWKTRGRPRRFYSEHSPAFIERQTAIALSDPNEETRIEALMIKGVRMPTASMLLQLAYPDRYPVLDVRALWALNCDVKRYTTDFWLQYLVFTREIAAQLGMSLRDLDRGLWEYAKKNQPKLNTKTASA